MSARLPVSAAVASSPSVSSKPSTVVAGLKRALITASASLIVRSSCPSLSLILARKRRSGIGHALTSMAAHAFPGEHDQPNQQRHRVDGERRNKECKNGITAHGASRLSRKNYR